MLANPQSDVSSGNILGYHNLYTLALHPIQVHKRYLRPHDKGCTHPAGLITIHNDDPDNFNRVYTSGPQTHEWILHTCRHATLLASPESIFLAPMELSSTQGAPNTARSMFSGNSQRLPCCAHCAPVSQIKPGSRVLTATSRRCAGST